MLWWRFVSDERVSFKVFLWNLLIITQVYYGLCLKLIKQRIPTASYCRRNCFVMAQSLLWWKVTICKQVLKLFLFLSLLLWGWIRGLWTIIILKKTSEAYNVWLSVFNCWNLDFLDYFWLFVYNLIDNFIKRPCWNVLCFIIILLWQIRKFSFSWWCVKDILIWIRTLLLIAFWTLHFVLLWK